MGLLKDLLPIAGAAAGYFLGGPAGSAAINAALGSGIGTLVAGGKPEDAVRNAILAGGAGAGLGAMGVAGAGAGGAAATTAGTTAAQQRILADQARMQAGQIAQQEAAKSGILGSGISVGDVVVGSSLLSMAGVGDEDITDEDTTLDPKDLESSPDYVGKNIKGLFIDPDTGIAYDTAEELEDAVRAKNLFAVGGIITLNQGGLIEGPGTGTSDDVKAGIYQNGKKVQEARLSDEEFVMTKKAVTGAGNGDSKLGAKRMYAMMDKFERMA